MQGGEPGSFNNNRQGDQGREYSETATKTRTYLLLLPSDVPSAAVQRDKIRPRKEKLGGLILGEESRIVTFLWISGGGKVRYWYLR